MARRWTEQDLDYLADHVGLLSYAELAKNLGRSEGALRQCRCRRKLPTFHNGLYYSATLLAQELGRSRTSIRKYHRKGWLVGERATWRAAYGKHPMLFLEECIVAFLRQFHHLFAWRGIPNLYFRNVVRDIQGV